MKKINIIFILLISTISFSQEELDCSDYLPFFEDLAQQHKILLISYCRKIETESNKANQHLNKTLLDKKTFVGNYFNFFMNNLESKVILKNLARNERYFSTCLKDENFKYDVKNLFNNTKEELTYDISNDFKENIDFMFDYILKKVKVK